MQQGAEPFRTADEHIALLHELPVDFRRALWGGQRCPEIQVVAHQRSGRPGRGDGGLQGGARGLGEDGKNAAAKDLGSTNGTRVNGRTITEVAIGADTQIQAGSNTYTFRVIARTVNTDMAVSE